MSIVAGLSTCVCVRIATHSHYRSKFRSARSAELEAPQFVLSFRRGNNFSKQERARQTFQRITYRSVK